MTRAKKPEDVVLVGPELPAGRGRLVLRKRGEQLESGAIRPAEEGKPIVGELVQLTARQEPGVFDVEVLHDARAKEDAKTRAPKTSAPMHKGPARIATDEYRRGWNRVFAKAKSN